MAGLCRASGLVLLLLGLPVHGARAASPAVQGLDMDVDTVSVDAADDKANLAQPTFGKVRGRVSLRPQAVVNGSM